MPRAEPIFNHQHYLQLDDFTYEYSLKQILAYEQSAYNDFRIMFETDISYDEFTSDDCPFCANLRSGLELAVFLKFYPETSPSMQEFARRDILAYWHNAYGLQSWHVEG